MNKIDKESIVDPSLPFDFYLNQLLYPKLQFQSHQMGSHYIEYFIAKVIKEGLNIYTLSVTKDIYPMIAEYYDINDKMVERSIRHSIETAWKRMSDQNKQAVFPIACETRPTNMEAIYAIYEYVKEYYSFDNEKTEQVVLSKLPFEKYLRELIYLTLQFDIGKKGSHYIEYFIAKIIREDLDIYAFGSTKDIYPMIAKHYNTSEKQVESSINYAIETAWKKASDESKKAIFPVIRGTKPTNTEAIYTIYEYVKEYCLFDNIYQSKNTTNETDQEIPSKISFERYLKQFIYFKLQFDSRIKGSHYIEYFITKIIKEDWNIYNFTATKSIYPTIAKHYGIDDKMVERAIRRAIETAWKRISEEDKKAIFPVIRGTRPTNTEAIYAIYEYIKGYYPFDNVDKQEIDIDGKRHVVSSNLLYYSFHFTLQKYLEEVYQIQTKFGIQNMNILIDMLFRMTKYDNVNIDEIITYLNHTYGFVDEKISSIHDRYIELSDALKFLFKICDQINEKNREEMDTAKDKVYIKKSIDKLLVQIKNIKV